MEFTRGWCFANRNTETCSLGQDNANAVACAKASLAMLEVEVRSQTAFATGAGAVVSVVSGSSDLPLIHTLITPMDHNLGLPCVCSYSVKRTHI